MRKNLFLRGLVEQLTQVLPEHMSALKNDFEKNCQHILNKTFNKFEIITREEFDVQTKVLARTRRKVEALENEIKKLELLIKNKA